MWSSGVSDDFDDYSERGIVRDDKGNRLSRWSCRYRRGGDSGDGVDRPLAQMTLFRRKVEVQPTSFGQIERERSARLGLQSAKIGRGRASENDICDSKGLFESRGRRRVGAS